MPLRKLDRRTSLVVVVIAVVTAIAIWVEIVYWLPAQDRHQPAPKSDSQQQLQDVIGEILGGVPNIKPVAPVQRATFMNATPNFVVGSSTSNGFTMHFNVDLWGTTHVAWTIQPHTVAAIDNYIHNYPYAAGASIGAMTAVGAAVCGVLLTGLGALACGSYFAVYQGYLIDQIHHAHLQNACVTVKVHVPLFKVFDPLHILWDVFPYVDTGSWCNRHVYITPPPPPNPQGPRMPGSVGTLCRPGDNVPVCL